MPESTDHKNKYLLPVILVIFLILEVSLLAIEGTLEQKIKAAEVTHPLPSEQLSAVLARRHQENLELTWDNGNQRKVIPLKEIADSSYRTYTRAENWRLDREKILALLSTIAPEINREAIDAKLEFSPEEGRIREFALPQTGLTLNPNRSIAQISSGLSQERLSIPLVIEEAQPKITASSIEKLGITTLLGKGESDFDGSSNSRITNNKVGSAKFHGLLVQPGEEFSFNKNLGDVEAVNGYQPELVIKGNRLVWEYGGGLCQVSTTLFRAAVYAGLPILERRPHSFPVRYYNPQGFDATIYPGVVDFRFKNDTPGLLLIQTKITGKKIAFEIYGSSDGRQVSVDGPYQYDQQTNGAMKAYFLRKISLADGSAKDEKFYSVYRPVISAPQAHNPLE